MVEGYFGLPGAGKTYWAVKMLLEAQQKNEYEHYFCNFAIKNTNYFRDLEKLVVPKNSLIVLDDADLWIDARDWFKQNFKQFLYRLRQSRKKEFDLIYTAGTPDDVEVRLRRCTAFYWYFRRYPFDTRKRCYFHRAFCWEKEKYRKEKQQPLTSNFFRINLKLAKNYDTMLDYMPDNYFNIN